MSARAMHAGQAAVDYLLLTALVAIAFGIALDGPLARLVRALFDQYQRFTWAIAQP